MKHFLFFTLIAACIMSLSLAAWGQNVALYGTQIRGEGADAKLSSKPLNLSRGGTIISVECNGDGFWIEGPSGVIKFSNNGAAMNYSLAIGTYKAYPNLKAGQHEAGVRLQIRPVGVVVNPPGGVTPSPAKSATSAGPLVGRWKINGGGLVGSADEKRIYYTGTLSIRSDGKNLSGTLNFGSDETLQGVSFNGNVLTFIRKNSACTQTYRGTLSGRRLTGTFMHKDAKQTATQYWDAQKI
jgi:hypothetical protein